MQSTEPDSVKTQSLCPPHENSSTITEEHPRRKGLRRSHSVSHPPSLSQSQSPLQRDRSESMPELQGDLSTRVTPVQLQDVADSKAVQNWKGVCRRLGVSEDVIAQSEAAHVTGTPNGPSKAFSTSLESWRDEQGDKATLYKLIQALKNSRFCEVVNTLTKSE